MEYSNFSDTNFFLKLLSCSNEPPDKFWAILVFVDSCPSIFFKWFRVPKSLRFCERALLDIQKKVVNPLFLGPFNKMYWCYNSCYEKSRQIGVLMQNWPFLLLGSEVQKFVRLAKIGVISTLISKTLQFTKKSWIKNLPDSDMFYFSCQLKNVMLEIVANLNGKVLWQL